MQFTSEIILSSFIFLQNVKILKARMARRAFRDREYA